MTEQEKRERVIKGLECCAIKDCIYKNPSIVCPYENLYGEYETAREACTTALAKDALALLKAFSAFKEYFDTLYGEGLDVVNWHMNGATESFDNFYDSAMEQYEDAKGK